LGDVRRVCFDLVGSAESYVWDGRNAKFYIAVGHCCSYCFVFDQSDDGQKGNEGVVIFGLEIRGCYLSLQTRGFYFKSGFIA
jgi:hypothetical protein